MNAQIHVATGVRACCCRVPWLCSVLLCFALLSSALRCSHGSAHRCTCSFSASVFELYEKEIATLRSTVASLEKGAARGSTGDEDGDEFEDDGDTKEDGKSPPQVPNLLELAAQARGGGRPRGRGYAERYRKHNNKKIDLRKRLAAMSSALARLRDENGELRTVTRKSELHQKWVPYRAREEERSDKRVRADLSCLLWSIYFLLSSALFCSALLCCAYLVRRRR